MASSKITSRTSRFREMFSEEDLGIDIARAIVYSDSQPNTTPAVRPPTDKKQDGPLGTLVWTTAAGSEPDAGTPSDGVTDIWIVPGISVSKETPQGLSHQDVAFLGDWMGRAAESSPGKSRSYVVAVDRDEREDLHVFAAGVVLAARQHQPRASQQQVVRAKSAGASTASASAWEFLDPWDYVDSWLLKETVASPLSAPKKRRRINKTRLSVEGITPAQKESHCARILAKQPAPHVAPQADALAALAAQPSTSSSTSSRPKFRAKLGRLFKKAKRAVGRAMAGAGNGMSGDVSGAVLAC